MRKWNISLTERTLAIYPTVKGFAFLVLEELVIIDYGNVHSQDKNCLLEKFCHLIDIYYIDRILIEKFTKNSLRKNKAQELIRFFKITVKIKKLKCSTYSKSQIQLIFDPQKAYTKYQRAKAVCELLQALNAILPEPRKIWQAENLAMSIFECATLSLTHIYLRRS